MDESIQNAREHGEFAMELREFKKAFDDHVEREEDDREEIKGELRENRQKVDEQLKEVMTAITEFKASYRALLVFGGVVVSIVTVVGVLLSHVNMKFS